jgi:hypothetical protein
MNKNTKDTANISLVALILVLVTASIIACGILIGTPFLLEWVIKLVRLFLF